MDIANGDAVNLAVIPLMESSTRVLTPNEQSQIATALQRLRDHFKEWPTDTGKEWYLVNFAYYEECGRRDQCCIDILRECAPLAMGQTLVNDHGFEWCMIKSPDSWRFAVRHSEITNPFDLYDLDEHPILDPDEHDEDTEPFDPGEGAHESIHAILRQIGQSVAYD